MNQWLSRVDMHGDMCDDWEAGLRQSESARRATPAELDQGPAAGLAVEAAQEALATPSAEPAAPSPRAGNQQAGAAASRGASNGPAASGAAPQPGAAAGRDCGGILPKKPPQPVSAGHALSCRSSRLCQLTSDGVSCCPLPAVSVNACNLSTVQSTPRLAVHLFLFAAGDGKSARAGTLAAACTPQA